jgi:tol-pal system protein YbgF
VLKLSALMLVGCCLAAPAQAGLFADDDARAKIQLLEKRIVQLESRVLKLEESLGRQTKSLLDLLGQIDALNSDIRKLRGQNEELAHGLQDAEKRSKDFYVDLDARLRHFESAEEAAREAGEKAAKEAPAVAAGIAAAPASEDPADPAIENRALESAYALFKAGSDAKAAKAFEDFVKKYPESVHVPNARFWQAEALYNLKNYKGAVDTYQELLKAYPTTPKAPDAMLNMAACQKQLKLVLGSKKTLNQLVAKYPDSEAAAKAKKLLEGSK